MFTCEHEKSSYLCTVILVGKLEEMTKYTNLQAQHISNEGIRWHIVCAVATIIFMAATSCFAQSSLQPIERVDTTYTARTFSLKNNLLYDATLTPNIGIEMKLNNHWSFGVNAGYRPWPTDDTKTRKYRHLMVAPTLRWWTDSTYHHRFFGATLVYSHYNVSDIKFPLGLYPSVKDHRKQGDLYAIGLSYGYSWRLNKTFRIELEGGADVGFTRYEEYDCVHCGTYYGKKTKPFAMPKLALNIVLNPVKKQYQVIKEEIIPIIPITPDTTITPITPITPVTPKPIPAIRQLMAENPVLEEFKNYRPYDSSRVLRKEKGMLYVHFPLDKSTLLHDFRDNGPILDRIVDITRQIVADSSSNVRLIQVIGLASVEGPVSRNQQLAQRRAEALRDYIKEHVPEATDDLFELNNGGEAWTELRDQINDEIINEKVKIKNDTNAEALNGALQIIDNEANADVREQKLRRLNRGATFQYIRDELMPDQRNSGYLRIYIDIDNEGLPLTPSE